MQDMPEKLRELRAEIDTHLPGYFEQLTGAMGVSVSPVGDQALELLGEFALRPAKRLRGALAIVAYEMFGGKNHRTALDMALAVELAQDYLLIIDDVMDRSDTRRGRATLHRQYRKILEDENVADSGHLGDMMGLSVGLLAQHLASRVLTEIDDDPERLVRAQRFFQTNIATTAFGQMDDLMNQASERYTVEETKRMYVLKSGYYTFVNPLQLGAVMAGTTNLEVLEPIREFGEHAGLAFQLQDDLLGMFGDETATGKSVMDDMHEGKMTLLIRHALGRADPAQLKRLRADYGNRHATRKQHAEVCDILTELGSRDYVTYEAQASAQDALAVLSAQTSWDIAGRRTLRDLVEYVVQRSE